MIPANTSTKMIYESCLAALLSRRENLIFQLEAISNQIADVRRQARKEGITLDK